MSAMIHTIIQSIHMNECPIVRIHYTHTHYMTLTHSPHAPTHASQMHSFVFLLAVTLYVYYYCNALQHTISISPVTLYLQFLSHQCKLYVICNTFDKISTVVTGISRSFTTT